MRYAQIHTKYAQPALNVRVRRVEFPPPRSWVGPLWRACIILAVSMIARVAADVVPGDRAALLDLYHAAGGPGWTNNMGWNTPADVCSWFGVSCTADGSRVMQLCVALFLFCV